MTIDLPFYSKSSSNFNFKPYKVGHLPSAKSNEVYFNIHDSPLLEYPLSLGNMTHSINRISRRMVLLRMGCQFNQQENS